MTNEVFIKSVSLDGEEWRDVIGYEGLYSVSSFGRVISLERIHRSIPNGTEIFRKMPPKLLKPAKMPNGYLFVHLFKNGKCKFTTLHRLVMNTFVGENNKYQVDHINTDITDNRLENLRYVSPKENQNNPLSKSHASIAKANKSNSRSRKIVCLKDGLLIKIYNAIFEARQDGFATTSISHCIKGFSKSHKGYKWMYLTDYENLVNKSKNVVSTNEAD